MASHAARKPVDENVQVPTAVRQAAERAEAAAAAYRENPPENSPPLIVNGGDQQRPAEPVVTPEVTQPEPAAPQPEAQPEKPRVEPGSVENQLLSMKGRLRDAQAEAQNLRELLATMQIAQPTPAAPPAKVTEYITDADREQWGPDMLDVIERKAKELIAPLHSELTFKLAQVDEKLGTVAQTRADDARGRMMSKLDQDIPDWQDINVHDDFVHNFLQQTDDFSGRLLHDMLTEAWNQNDAPRVAAFFKRFKGSASATPQSQPAPQPSKAPVVTLESLAAPGKANGGGAPTAAPEPEIISRADITRFFADKAAGKFKGQEAIADQYEKEIFEAQRLGRIR